MKKLPQIVLSPFLRRFNLPKGPQMTIGIVENHGRFKLINLHQNETIAACPSGKAIVAAMFMGDPDGTCTFTASVTALRFGFIVELREPGNKQVFPLAMCQSMACALEVAEAINDRSVNLPDRG